MAAERKLADLGLVLPPPSKPVGNYVAATRIGSVLYLSGVGPAWPDGGYVTGTLGADLTVAQGYQAARLCGLVLLANLRRAIGSLDDVVRIAKVFGMVRCVPGFGEQPEVINGCTDLFVDIFGEAGRPARSAVGMIALPRGIAVEIEAIAEIRT
jgi:enamine deaminase RidA (YjgF/YER057c/UK114 family)